MSVIPEAFALDWLVATYGVTGAIVWVACLQMAVVTLLWPWVEPGPSTIHRQTP